MLEAPTYYNYIYVVKWGWHDYIREQLHAESLISSKFLDSSGTCRQMLVWVYDFVKTMEQLELSPKGR